MKKTVLILTGQYLPGFKGGGPIKSISNIVEHLGEEFNFKIITSDRDLGDREGYKNIEFNKWIKFNGVDVIYLEPSKQKFSDMKRIINGIDYDVMYLTGYFSHKFTLIPIILRRLRLIKRKKVILAPRGDFSPGALKNKELKKRIFINVSKFIGLYKNIKWHATSEHEKFDIERIYGNKCRIYIANNLPKKNIKKYKNKSKKEVGKLSIVFISRISPKKNIIYSLELLKNIHDIEINFDIYGPIEDKDYWKRCEEIIKILPRNIHVAYNGNLNPDDVAKKFSDYNLFLFPTMGENFGHVILEAIIGSCPLLISNKTPWLGLEEKGVGFDVPIERNDLFIKYIRYYAFLDGIKFKEVTNNMHIYLDEIISNNKDIELTKKMFYELSR
ncbi:glycosyltransferase [Clostridium perfringens]|nr:glycosyltransferase [Clostridium perfringens]